MRCVEVKGISSIGTNREMRYSMFDEMNDFEAIKKALRWADEEYNVQRKDGKIIPNSEYKEFEKITSIAIIEY